MTNTRPRARAGYLALVGILLACCAGVMAVMLLLAVRLNNSRAAGGPSVVYILDTSARMQQPADGGSGQTRLDAARAVLAELIRPADPALVSGLRVFGNGKEPDPCRDTNLAVPFDMANQSNIISGLNTLAPGASPDAALTAAMVAAIRDLSARPGPHWLIVVTGGADTCGPDGNQLVAQELQRAGIELESFVIGFQISQAEQEAVASMMSELPGGTFVAASNTGELESAVDVLEDRIASPSDLLTRLAPGASSTQTLVATPSATATLLPTTPAPPDTPVGPTAAATASEPGATNTTVSGASPTPSATAVVKFTRTPTPGRTLVTRFTPTPTPGRTLIIRPTSTPLSKVTDTPAPRPTIVIRPTNTPVPIVITKPPPPPTEPIIIATRPPLPPTEPPPPPPTEPIIIKPPPPVEPAPTEPREIIVTRPSP